MESKFSVKDRILAELRKSGNARKVRKNCKSISLFSETLNIYLDERMIELEELNIERDNLVASAT
jgi:hypothetical protein